MASDQPDQDAERYARHLVLPGFGAAAQARLAEASVFVLGAGGLGSPVISYLAASGVGRLTIVDDDAVSLSNLQRQVIHTTDDLGRPKVGSARDRAVALNPGCHVKAVQQRLTSENADALIAGQDLVIDACDRFASRTALADACQRQRLTEVYGAVLGWEGQLTVLEPGRTLASIFGEFPEDAPTGAQVGILATLPGVIGAAMATEALKLLTGTGEPLLGKLQTYDARTGAWRCFTLAPLEPTKESA